MTRAYSGNEGGAGGFPELFYKCCDPDCAAVVEWTAEHICGGGGTGHGCEKVFCAADLFLATTEYGDALLDIDGEMDVYGSADPLPHMCASCCATYRDVAWYYR